LKIPDAQASLNLQIKDRRCAAEGRLRPNGADEIKWLADVPLFGATQEGGWTLVDRSKPWNLLLELPPTDLASFAPVWAGATFDRGVLRGKVQVGGLPSDPQSDGSLAWKNGRIRFPGSWLPMEDVETTIAFKGSEAVLEGARGRMGEGTFGMAGKVGFANWRDPQWEAQLRGENLSLYADENLRLKGAAEISARGSQASGEIKGAIGLDGSAVLRTLTVAPSLVAAVPSDTPTAKAPTKNSFATWSLDLKLASAAPLPIGPDGVDGTLVPDLYVQGTAGEPVMIGTVHADKFRIAWPSGAKVSAAGRVHFTREKPWMPVLDLAGAGEAGPYDIRAGAFGPLDERKLFLSSAPPLNGEQIVLLLTTGVSPVLSTGAEIAPPSAEQKMSSEPSWLDLEKVRGLLGWGTQAPDNQVTAEWSLGRDAVGYEWSWK